MNSQFLKFKTHFSSLEGIDENDIDLALPFFEEKTLKKGDHFIREGNNCNLIAFITKGLFRIYLNKDGEELNTCFCFENSIFSSFNSFVNRVPSNENIEALEESTIVTLSFEQVSKLSEQSPSWARIRSSLTEKECLRLANRVNEMSFETALGRYQNLIDNEPQIIQRVSNYHIASYLGITKETLSRIRSKVSL